MHSIRSYVAGGVVVTALLASNGRFGDSAASAPAPAPASANLICAQTVVANWTPSQLANETIVVPVNALNIGAMGPAARAGYGGLLLLGATAPATLTATLGRLQAMTPHQYAMMVMVDEEGGGVQRLTNLVGSIPWAQTMGRHLTAPQITAVGLRIGRALSAAGVNVDLAPVLDVDGRAVYPGASNPDGLRSFGGSPALVATDATAFMIGLSQAHVTSVVKHFPGLGGSTGNTDSGPARTLAWSVLQRTALVPFRRAIASGASAVMLSNASVPGLTALPASLSATVVDYLRQTLGFQGLIVTDSLSAGAIGVRHLTVGAAAVAALLAGDDQILFGTPSSPIAALGEAAQISAAIVTAVAQGSLPIATLRAAAALVLATRNTLACPVVPTTGLL